MIKLAQAGSFVVEVLVLLGVLGVIAAVWLKLSNRQEWREAIGAAAVCCLAGCALFYLGYFGYL